MKTFRIITFTFLCVSLATTRLCGAENRDFSETRKKAEIGDVDAQYEVAEAFQYGLYGYQKDYTEYCRWIAKAAAAGHTAAKLRLVETDAAKAHFFATKKLAESDNIDAQSELGLLYQYGKGVQKDYEKAFKWLTKAAEAGNAKAQSALGHLYDNPGDYKNLSLAAKWYRRAADQGKPQAQYYLGWNYSIGRGIKKDTLQALKWLKLAAISSDEYVSRNALKALSGTDYYADKSLYVRPSELDAESDLLVASFKPHKETILAQDTNSVWNSLALAYGAEKTPLSQNDREVLATIYSLAAEWNQVSTPLVRDVLDPKVSVEHWLQFASVPFSRLKTIYSEMVEQPKLLQDQGVRLTLQPSIAAHAELLAAYYQLRNALLSADAAKEQAALKNLRVGGERKLAAGKPILDRLRQSLGTDQVDQLLDQEFSKFKAGIFPTKTP